MRKVLVAVAAIGLGLGSGAIVATGEPSAPPEEESFTEATLAVSGMT